MNLSKQFIDLKNVLAPLVKESIRESNSNDFDLDICFQGHDAKWSSINFNRRSSPFVKKV